MIDEEAPQDEEAIENSKRRAKSAFHKLKRRHGGEASAISEQSGEEYEDAVEETNEGVAKKHMHLPAHLEAESWREEDESER